MDNCGKLLIRAFQVVLHERGPFSSFYTVDPRYVKTEEHPKITQRIKTAQKLNNCLKTHDLKSPL